LRAISMRYRARLQFAVRPFGTIGKRSRATNCGVRSI
jgi:hypothetical protein